MKLKASCGFKDCNWTMTIDNDFPDDMSLVEAVEQGLVKLDSVKARALDHYVNMHGVAGLIWES